MVDTDEPVLRVGVIGMGFLGKVTGRELGRTERGELAAITDISDENLQAAAEEFDVPEENQYADYEEMIANENLDAIAVTTPHGLHAEQLLTGLDNGLHVLCEKPLCTNLEDAYEIVERTERSDRTVMLGYQRHLASAFIEAREYWHEDGRESPDFVTAEVTQDWIDAVEGSWKADPDLSGGGQLYDTGSHLVDSVLWMTGLTPTSVSADMIFHDEAERVDTQATLTVQFEEDAVASIAVSGDAPRVDEHIRIWGEDGATCIDGREWNPRRYREIDREGTIVDPNVSPGSVQPKTEAFIESIREGTEPPATVYDGLYATALTEAAYEAAWTGERVDIDL
ncbi:Gfo/Idh/MocA family protein [Halomontanus rarus]|uniref:Gfo/Idh/MocA family protein n=1 Tax=Halomontanus rarus TaxID=3034020 RepID=UPI0023E7D049|nr:Gfo/Idh/MocA family oxidoreductase [Halovivax sp. TS33]